MKENNIVSEIKYDKGEIKEQTENKNINEEYINTKTKSIKEKKIQNLKTLKSYFEKNKNENLESLENKNDYRENQRHHLQTEVQELNSKNNNIQEGKSDKANKLALLDNNSKSDLMKIDDLEHFSRLLKKKIEIQKKTKCFKIKIFFEKILDNNIYIIFMMAITIFILFISDIQNGWLEKTVDKPIEIMQTIIFCFYFLEIIITSICKKGYINSFFFWLDILSTIYIIQDISFIINKIMGLDNSDQ
jgi:hypothetical protein